jgi:hypothetical protein
MDRSPDETGVQMVGVPHRVKSHVRSRAGPEPLFVSRQARAEWRRALLSLRPAPRW